MKVAGMVVWVLTAGIGIYLLAAGIAAQRLAGTDGATLAGTDGATLAGTDGATLAGTAALARGALGSGAAVAGAGAAGAAVGGAGAGGPGGGGSRAPEGSPLLEFSHPLLALTGLTFWIFYVMTNDRLFAWIAFGVVVATVLAGLGWVLMTRRSARQRAAAPDATAQPDHAPGAPGPGFPVHLVMIHGLAAACTFALVVIAAATAAHG